VPRIMAALTKRVGGILLDLEIPLDSQLRDFPSRPYSLSPNRRRVKKIENCSLRHRNVSPSCLGSTLDRSLRIRILADDLRLGG
jgi:hypothetical protein